AVRHRLSGMDADTRAVLNNLAVLGECDVALLSAVTGLSSEALSSALHRACDSTLLVETSTSLGVGWRHALIRELVGAGLLPHERQTLAHTAADQLNFLIGEGTDETCHRQAAALYELAGMPNVAAQHLVHAARSAVRSAALDAAAQDLSRAQALAGAMPEAALDVLVERTETLTLAGRAHDAYRDGVLALGTAVGRRNRRLTFATARAGYAAGLVAQASRLWTDLPADPDDPEAALLAVYDAVARRHHDVVELGEQAAQLATDRGRVDLACEALYLAGRASRRYSISRSEQLLQQTMHLSEQHGQSVWRVRVLAALGAGDLADPELGSSRLERARELAVSAGMAGTVAWIDLRLGELTILRSGYIAAYPTIARADAQARSLRLTGLGADARVRVAECRLWAADQPLPGRHRSHGGTVDDLMAEALEFGEEGIHVPYSRFVFGARAWLEGDTAAAVRIIEESLDYLREEVKFVPWWGFGKLLSVTCGNDPDTAFGPEFRRGHGVNHAAYAYAKAVVAIDHGEAHLTWIKRAEDQLGSFKFITHVLRTAIATKVFAVEPDLVRGWLREADAFCAMAGEPALQRRVRQTMAALGSKLPRSRTGTVPPHLARLGLTGRETEILRMINIGASNTDIADRLVLSVRTVESHVSSMLAKTGKLTRAELPLVAE
ncbi:MAG TPA: helix-turn-helix transcriptional regulator, partial [Mycobacterium sp.]